MDWIRVVPVGQGIPAQQLEQALVEGWVCIPKVSVSRGGGAIAVPGQEGSGVEVVDVWYRPMGLVPSGKLIAVLQAAVEKDPEWVVVDFLSRHLLGMSAEEVLRYGKEGNQE